MNEVFDILFHPLPNAIMTLLMGLSLVYWLFTMLLGDGFEFGEANVDFEGADMQDIDAPDDLDGDTDADGEPSFWSKAMDYINIGKAPMMVIVTLFKFIGWIITIASSIALSLSQYGWKSVLILIPIFLLTYFLMHYVTIPVVKLYQKVGYQGEEAHDYLGRVGKMKSTIQGDNIGSAEIVINQDVIRLPVKSRNGERIAYGDTVVVTNETGDGKIYFVEKEITLNTI
ncbi:OB-fold-containig protein [Sphingobacterium hungaricum]|uniref:Uncharacterized protein n=1 Tax=Sphingobacterium hungaricum TaxID=2082723 RepID=A0A928UYK8_9SPHI|nr:OB-fold-containig protein [Sphingobacterium hungaricum]MBE8713484.1 hypothetical protein [Sphingobacterium hungaricum]